MKISSNGLDLIKKSEGLKLKAYKDSVGISTIGIGTIRYPNGRAVSMGDTCTEGQALEYLTHDLAGFESTINANVKVPLAQNQYDALCLLVYNIGSGAFVKSTLLKKLNAKDYAGAADQFLVWNKAGGHVIAGLVARRNNERDLFLK